jgi:transcriptional repressor|nr:MAG TPA: bifunctional HTH-domain containing protein/aminotransferase [Caudoviricetes sp.]
MKGKCSDRIKEALNLRDMKPIELVEQSGVKKSALSQYMSGKITPRQKALNSMAKVLDVSPAWLMGFDVPMEREDILKDTKFQEKIINKDSKVELKGDFTITENIEGEYIRILSVFNDRTADERIYDLKTNKYNEKKINKIIISFNIDNEDYTAEDTNKFIKLFSEYKKLSDDKQKEIDSIIYGKEKRNNYIDYINFSESFDKDTFLDIKNYYKIPTTTETKKSLIKSNCIISTFYTLDLNTTKNIKSTVLEKDSDSKNVLSDKIYIPKVSLKNNESNTKK